MAQPVLTSEPTSATPRASLPSTLPALIELQVALSLWAWPTLTFAISNSFGGSPEVAAEKRELLAGAVSELLTSKPASLHEVADLEEVLLHVMNDEFELVVDDGSAQETAEAIWRGMEKLAKGDVGDLEAAYTKYLEKQKSGKKEQVNFVQGKDDEGEETDWDDEDEFNGFDDDDEQDVEMGNTPDSAQKKEKPAPEIDEDGFTKVVGKKNR